MPVRIITTHLEFEGEFEETHVVMEGEEPPVWGPDANLTIVGQPTPRVDARERVTGRAEYTADVLLPGMLTARLLRSPHPHARVRAIDASRAEALAGVRAVYHRFNTSDLPNYRPWIPMFPEEVRYAGDEVALVVAENAAVAAAALDLIAVEYESLPFVVDPESALAAAAPRVVSDAASNLIAGDEYPRRYQRGDAAAAFATAEVVIETRFETPTVLHSCLEPHGSVAAWDGRTLTVWCSTQDIHGARQSIASVLSLPLNRVRVIKQYMGGGFGSKFAAGKPGPLAGYAAMKLGRPVKLMLDRHEEQLTSGNRPPSIQHYRLGARRDGTLTAMSLRAISGVGAYGAWIFGVAGATKELYACANVQIEEVPALTNLGTQAAFRAPGVVEGIAGLETAIDQLALQLGMDSLELRRKNCATRYQVLDRPYAAKTLLEAYDVGAAAIGWATRDDPARRYPRGKAGALRRGVGMASQLWGGDGGPPAQAMAKLLPDGSAVILTGTQDIGTGTRTVLAQIAAEELGLPLDQVRVELGDTEYGLFSPPSGGSMTLASVGPAVRMAAVEVKKELLEIVGQLSEAPADALEVRDGAIFTRDTGKRLGTLGDFLGRLDGHELIAKGMRGPNAEDVTVRTFGAQFAEVEVDTGTGVVRVLRIVAVHDIGRVVNPLTL
ncbi:MAG TPA: xanthine dehydrogenase family protein molybdopterin-binding subunit, partial [Ktedonobacterales bacterium]|nr:xanthine dehydrogenase family protein molybdopterin-binding subunit [Ktedonobacterales bacterium]